MTKLSKPQMHQRPTYEALVRDTILEPKDKITLPNRTAINLRKTQQLSRYDDSEFLDMEADNENIAKEQAQHQSVQTAAGNDAGGSLGEARAFQPGRNQGHNFTTPPPPQPPGAGGMPRQSPNTSHQAHAPIFQAASSSTGPPPPPSTAPKIAAGR